MGINMEEKKASCPNYLIRKNVDLLRSFKCMKVYRPIVFNR
jgi:hypothetical protein